MLSKSKKDKSFKEEIFQWLSQFKFQKQYEYKSIRQYWEDTVGKVVAARTQRVVFNGTVLSVTLDSAVLKNEIMLHKKHIIKELNMKLQKIKVHDLKIY